MHDFSSSHIEELASAGVEFFVQLEDGTREKVSADAVKPPDNAKSGSAELATREYIDERMSALLNLMEDSIVPALALVPASTRRGIQKTYDTFKNLVEEVQDGNIDSR